MLPATGGGRITTGCILSACVLSVFILASALAENTEKSSDSPKSIEAIVGEEIVIILESNPTTGYQWQIAKPLDTKILEAVKSEYAPDFPDRVGSPGKEEWLFKAVGEGKTTVFFKYVRPWEKDKPPEKEKSFGVTVKEAASEAIDTVQVISVSGNPKIMRSGTSAWIDCVSNMLIEDGDRIKTGTNERLEISFSTDDSKVIGIEENSDVVIIRGRSPYSVELFNGEALAVIKNLPPDSSFEIRTPTAISGVRGTEWLTSTDGKTTTFGVFDNEIYTKGISASGKVLAEETILRKGWKLEVPKNKNPLPPVKLSRNETARWNSWKKGLDKTVKAREIKRPGMQKKVPGQPQVKDRRFDKSKQSASARATRPAVKPVPVKGTSQKQALPALFKKLPIQAAPKAKKSITMPAGTEKKPKVPAKKSVPQKIKLSR